MEDLPIFFYPENAGQPFGSCHLALQRNQANHTPGLYLDSMILQIAPTGYIDIMGSITSHQEADFTRDKGRVCTGRGLTGFTGVEPETTATLSSEAW